MVSSTLLVLMVSLPGVPRQLDLPNPVASPEKIVDVRGIPFVVNQLGEDGGWGPEVALLRGGSQPVLDGDNHCQLQLGAVSQTETGSSVNRGPSLSGKLATPPADTQPDRHRRLTHHQPNQFQGLRQFDATRSPPDTPPLPISTPC